MKTLELGSKVNYKVTGTVNYLKNGIVTGFQSDYNRVYVTWPQHGASSIPEKNLELAN